MSNTNMTPQPMTDEPFGYFRALPFGWEQCAETDEGAIALYERPQKAQPAPSVPDGYALVREALQNVIEAHDANIAELGENMRAHGVRSVMLIGQEGARIVRMSEAITGAREALSAAPKASVPDDVRKDADRYRWLAAYCRSTSEHWGGRWSIVIDGPAPKSHDSEDDLDEAIDAAIAAAQQGGV